jgi:hypothetical protein
VSTIIIAGGDRIIQTLLIFLALIHLVTVWVDNPSLLGLAKVNLFYFLFATFTFITVAIIASILVN